MKDFKRQIPNAITWSRIALMIPTLACFFTGNVVLATGIFSVAALTDGIDGYVARKHGWVSKFGAHLDAFCDKMYVALGSVMPIITSGAIYSIPLIMEGVISAYNLYRHYIKKQDVKSSKIGKIKTCLLFPALILGMCAPNLGISKEIVNSFVIATSALQGATLASYVVDSKKQEKVKLMDQIFGNIEIEHNEDIEEEKVKEKESKTAKRYRHVTTICDDLRKIKDPDYQIPVTDFRDVDLTQRGRARKRRL